MYKSRYTQRAYCKCRAETQTRTFILVGFFLLCAAFLLRRGSLWDGDGWGVEWAGGGSLNEWKYYTNGWNTHIRIWLKLPAEAGALYWFVCVYRFLWVYLYMNKCVRQHFCSSKSVCVCVCVYETVILPHTWACLQTTSIFLRVFL